MKKISGHLKAIETESNSAANMIDHISKLLSNLKINSPKADTFSIKYKFGKVLNNKIEE